VPDVVFINGTVGAGKTTVADALSDHERSQGRPHAVIDLDQLRRLWPSTEADPFHHELELQSLAVVAANYRRFGTQHFILAGVIESADEVPRYKEALNIDSLLICRLVVEDKVAEERLRRRHGSHSEALDWHLARIKVLSGILDRAQLDDLVFDTTSRDPHQVAAEIRCAAGWC
jgi:adenylylsulfate kinase-like enzyme